MIVQVHISDNFQTNLGVLKMVFKILKIKCMNKYEFYRHSNYNGT